MPISKRSIIKGPTYFSVKEEKKGFSISNEDLQKYIITFLKNGGTITKLPSQLNEYDSNPYRHAIRNKQTSKFEE